MTPSTPVMLLLVVMFNLTRPWGMPALQRRFGASSAQAACVHMWRLDTCCKSKWRHACGTCMHWMHAWSVTNAPGPAGCSSCMCHATVYSSNRD